MEKLQCADCGDSICVQKLRTYSFGQFTFIDKLKIVSFTRPTPNIELIQRKDTEELYTIGFQEIASRFGKNFTYDLKVNIMGKQSEELAASIIEALELPMTVGEFVKESRIIFQKLFPQCKVMPGIEKLIRHLRDNNIPIGLATSSSKDSYDLKACHHSELFDLFPYKTWGSSDPEVKRGKPFPDIFIVAAAKFPEKPAPEKCLVFEDSVNGVRAAISAGMQVVMVPDPQLARAHTAEATLVLPSAELFQPELFGLPPYEGSQCLLTDSVMQAPREGKTA